MLVALVVVLVAVPAFAKTEVKSADEDGKVEVTFTYGENLGANAVFVAGQFNNWSPNHPFWRMKKENGVWTLTKKLDKGEKYQYKFTVYGGGELKWIKDEDAATFEADGFGGQNSVLIAKTSVDLTPRVRELESKMATVNQGFSYSGYMRAGALMSTEGGTMNGHIGLFPNHFSRFRLGNEEDTYVENVFGKKFTQDDGSWMKAQIRLANKKTDYHTYNSQNDEESTVREAFVIGSGFDFAPNVTFWAGERFYGRSDIHITDNRWRELDGFGGGVQGLDLGAAKLDAALIVRNSQGDGASQVVDTDIEGGKNQKNIDLRFKGIQVPGGQLEVETRYAWQDETTDRSGYQLDFVYSRPDFYGIANGSSNVILQYGDDLGADLGNPVGFTSEEANGYALIAYGLANINENWDVMPQLVYEDIDSKYNGGADAEKRIAIGGRAVRYLSNNLSMQFEYGYESQEAGWHDEALSLQKFTVAPTIKLDNSFWGRPEIRVFATYGTFDDGNNTWRGPIHRGAGEGNNDDNGGNFGFEQGNDDVITYGIQTELWW
nr:carbohydrate porin [Halanaerobacter jeridensis]